MLRLAAAKGKTMSARLVQQGVVAVVAFVLVGCWQTDGERVGGASPSPRERSPAGQETPRADGGSPALPDRDPHELNPFFVTLGELEDTFETPPLRIRDLLGPYDRAGLPPQCQTVFMGGIEAGGSWRDIDHQMHFYLAAPMEPGWSFLVNVSEYTTVEGAQEAFDGSLATLSPCAGFLEQGVEWETEAVREVAAGDGAFTYVGAAEQSYPPGRVSELGHARVCWIYVAVHDRITAIGVHGPQRDLDGQHCEAAATVAAERLQ